MENKGIVLMVQINLLHERIHGLSLTYNYIEDSEKRTALGFSSLLSDVAPPDPIPNSAVKRVSADNTCVARFREDRSRLGNRRAVFFVV